MSDVFINKKIWDKFGVEQMRRFKENVFQHYRLNGFPYYKLSQVERIAEFEKITKYDIDSVIESDVVKQTMHGLGLAWSYFPHAFNVRCNDAKTPLEAFNDDAMLRKAIDKRIKYGTYMTDSGMRKTLKTMSGVQAVSNFRPTAAAAIYRRYLSDIEGGGKVWDMSAGFGGRMIGAAASGVVSYYVGTDPCRATYKGLRELILDGVLHCKYVNEDGTPVTTLCSVQQIGSEDFKMLSEGSMDMCFTSPPYFNTEKYSDEPTQSYLRFPSPGLWLAGYMRTTLFNCWFALKRGGILALNVADVKSYPTLASDVNDLAQKCGFEPVEKLKLQLSRMIGTKIANDKFKYEPIFVLRKP